MSGKLSAEQEIAFLRADVRRLTYINKVQKERESQLRAERNKLMSKVLELEEAVLFWRAKYDKIKTRD